MTRAELTEKLLGVKREKGWSWTFMCSQIGGRQLWGNILKNSSAQQPPPPVLPLDAKRRDGRLQLALGDLGNLERQAHFRLGARAAQKGTQQPFDALGPYGWCRRSGGRRHGGRSE